MQMYRGIDEASLSYERFLGRERKVSIPAKRHDGDTENVRLTGLIDRFSSKQRFAEIQTIPTDLDLDRTGPENASKGVIGQKI